MKRKYFSALLMGALTIASVSTFTSCKDYDDDISNLQQQIDANKSTIEELSKLIKAGSVITDVKQATNGVTVTLSDGKTFSITNGLNGADGAPGTAWTIGDDGYWYKDGTKTDNWARGPQGEKGDQGEKGETGPAGPAGAPGTDASAASYEYYVPNAETGYFDIYKNGEKIAQSNVKFVQEVSNTITAVKDNKTLTLCGVAGGEGQNKTVVISLSGTLSSLSFRPHLYLEGIETIPYAWLSGDVLKGVSAQADKNYQNKNYVFENAADYVKDAPKSPFQYGPAWAVEYDASPWNADVQKEDLAGYNVITATVNTRATGSNLGEVTSPAFAYAGLNKATEEGKQLFSMDNGKGVLTAGLQIERPWNLNVNSTAAGSNEANTVALRVKNNEGKEVVADYALVQPEKTILDGLVWREDPTCTLENGTTYVTTNADESCSNGDAKNHMWDTPEEALAKKPTLSILYNDEEGVDLLNKYVAIRLKKTLNAKTGATNEFFTITPEDAKQWGLSFEFHNVKYKLDTNVTSEDQFLSCSEDGKIHALNPMTDGTTNNEKAAVGREPLVQVLVKNTKNQVVLDGYIHLYITTEAKPNQKNELWPMQTVQFDPCNANDVFQTTWLEFNDYVLTQNMNMSKETFDHEYEPDLNDASGTFKQFADWKEKGEQDVNVNALGDVLYKGNTVGNTNHTWRWVITPEEIEAKLHHQASVTLTTWIRFKAKDKVSAAYPYVYIKLVTTINNKKTNTYAFGDKNSAYWFDNNNAVIFDVYNPSNGGDIEVINRGVRSTLLENKESFNAPNHRYYFIPKSVVITSQSGVKYTLIPKSSNGLYNKVYCKLVTAPVADIHNYDDAATVLKTCALDLTKGAYANNKLYAVSGGVETLVATINPTTGEIKLDKNPVTKAIFNAVGYAKDHANAYKQLHAHVGIATGNTCNVVEETTNDKFVASWLRPINLIKYTKPAVDANTNGNEINILDCVKLYDWRGWKNSETEADCVANQSNMWGDNWWFWAYYNVNKITLDLRNNKVKTNMHNGTWQTLDKVTGMLSLSAGKNLATAQKNTFVPFTFDLTGLNEADRNAEVKGKLNAAVGKIFYTNNGSVVKPFEITIPVVISYEWGEIQSEVTITVDPTIGHE